MSLLSYDRKYRKQGYELIAGIDEAGRGPWAGPVVAAAVIFPPDIALEGLRDSKKLSPKRREKLFTKITGSALAVGIGVVGHETIDSVNILRAAHIAMKEALDSLSAPPELVLVDGRPVPSLGRDHIAIVRGDGKSASIAAASIIAKVTRDRIMERMASDFPQYGFERHKGYGTKEHFEALMRFGPCPFHRKTFRPVRECLAAAGDA